MPDDPIRFDDYDAIREALLHAHLSRTLDKRSFEQGNPRAGTLSLLHGAEHKRRRRLENRLFQRRALVQYERDLFPTVLAEMLDDAAVGRVDLFELSGALSVVLAARRAGIDHDGSRQQLTQLFDYVKVIAQAAAVLDVVGDRDRVQTETIQVLQKLDEHYVTPPRRRRERLLDSLAGAEGEEEVPPSDLLTVALQQLRAGDATFADHRLLVREAALFLHGGSHTSAQTVCNVFYFLFGLDGSPPRTEWLRRVAEDPLDAQKCVHETVRLRPPNPEMKRRAERDAEVAGTRLQRGDTVVLDARKANSDPALFGADPERFDPDREIRDDVPLWGLSFGVGPHICIGRSVAGGFPLTGARLRGDLPPAHLHGLVALMVQAMAACDVQADPYLAPQLDRRTTRGTRWLRFPVRFPTRTARVRELDRRPAG